MLVAQGSVARVVCKVATSPAAYGKADSLTWAGCLTVGAESTDLSMDGLEAYELSTPSGEGSVTVDGTPAFSSGGGPSGEDVYNVTVVSVGEVDVGDYVKARGKGSAKTFKVLYAVGTTLRLHAWNDSLDIDDGDVLDIVNPTGVYACVVPLSVDDFLDADTPVGELTLTAVAVTAGQGPKFSSAFTIGDVQQLELSSRAYVTAG